MNVRELIEQLATYDPESPVVNEMDEEVFDVEENSDPTSAIVLVFR